MSPLDTHDGPVQRNGQRLAFEELTYAIIGAFYAVYNVLGYGFLESVYRNALVVELRRRGLQVHHEVPVEVFYLGESVGFFRMDIVVEGKVLLEVKSSAALGDSNPRQVFNYLRASKLPVALLLHFGPKPSYKRFVSPIFERR
jgi:GxxExxY protein